MPNETSPQSCCSSFTPPHDPEACVVWRETFAAAGTNFGTYAWPSALFLTTWLAKHRDSLLLSPAAAVLEVGCGVAIPALYAAHHAKTVLLHDSPSNAALLESQLQLNGASLCATTRVIAATWAAADACERLLAAIGETRLTLVLAADLFYHKRDFADVLALLVAVMWAHPLAACFVVYDERNLNYTLAPHCRLFGVRCLLVEKCGDLHLLRLRLDSH